jgi:hypothetical protein
MTYLVQVTRVGFPDQHYRLGLVAGETPTTATFTYHIYNNLTAPDVITQNGQTNYLFNRGHVRTVQHEGPFRYNKTTSGPATTLSIGGVPTDRGMAIAGISDGTSNTVFFMETNGGFLNAFGTSGWLGMNWGHAPFYSDFWICPNSQNGNCNFTQGRGYGWGLPSSAHSGGAIIMTAFGDGSVRSISPATAFVVFRSMCGSNDTEVVTFN